MERGNVPRVLEIDQMNNSRDNKTSTDEMNFLLCGKCIFSKICDIFCTNQLFGIFNKLN